jgi:4-oxalomesaconate tautomerase
MMMRGGTSKGAFFVKDDLPADTAARDRVLLAAMGSPDPRQIDGIGGAHPLTSKVAIVSRSTRPDADLDYLFAQVVVDEARVDVSPTCGNMLAGVAPFALERGLVTVDAVDDSARRVRIFMVNTESLCEARIETESGAARYDGAARISGVPGASAPVLLTFLDTEGSSCGSLLPTGNAVDMIDGVAVTCIDNGMPVVVIDARDLGRTGYETCAELNADADLKARIESIRLQVGPRMNLGDVTRKVVPKMTLVAPAREGGTICSRTFIPHVCHEAIGVLGAVSVATACVLPGSVAARCSSVVGGDRKLVSVAHPPGEFSVELETRASPRGVDVLSAALLRTTRALFDGCVLVPSAVLEPASIAHEPAPPARQAGDATARERTPTEKA